MSINEFNRRIRVNKYIDGQDDSGGNVKSLVEQFDVWAKLENMNGSKYLDNLQITYSKAFKITTRYESTRALITTDEIVYDGLTYSIQSLTQLEEGRKNFNVMIAYTTGTESNTGDIITGAEQSNYVIGETLIGLVDGVNTIFITANSYQAGKIMVFRNGQRQRGDGNDYTETGNQTIEFVIPPIRGIITADYFKI